MAFVRMLSKLLDHAGVGRYVVPIVPDEARTFGMEALFRKAGIYSSEGQKYRPVDSSTLMPYREATDGQILQEGICEAGAMASFMAAFGPTGYMTFIKVLELFGGILVAIPRTRNFGLLILGPILVNILAYHTFLAKGATLFDPMLIVICLLAAYLLWVGRKQFSALLN